jgi:hypothetical protein
MNALRDNGGISGGNDGGYSGGNGGGNFGGSDGWDFDDNEERRGGPMRPLLILAALAVAIVATPKALDGIRQALRGKFGPEYDVEPVAMLKRLVRELFERDVQVQARLAELEKRVGISGDTGSSGQALGVSLVSTQNHEAGSQRSHYHQGPSSNLGGRLTLGGGFMWSNTAENLDAVVDSGVQLGTLLTLQSRGKFRNGRDFILTDVNIDGASQEQFNLQKVLYSCGLVDNLRVMLAPFGARGNDVTYTLNPFAGRGLTDGNAEGNPLLHNRGKGAAAGATLSLPRMWLTGAYFRNEDNEDGDKTLLQALVAPTRRLSLGLTLLEDPSGNSSVAYKLLNLLGSARLTTEAKADPEVAGTVALSLGDNFAVHGWAAAHSFASMMDTSSTSTTWNVSFGDTLRGSSRWVASVGKVDQLSNNGALAPDTMEFSTEFDLGNGMTWQPGMVAVRDRQERWTVLAGAKAVWDF